MKQPTFPIMQLIACKPLAQRLTEVFDLQNHSLPASEKQMMQVFFELRACKSYIQVKFLCVEADLTNDQFNNLEDMYTEMIFRYLEGRSMQTGRKLTIVGRWLQWLDVKLNWKIKLPGKVVLNTKKH